MRTFTKNEIRRAEMDLDDPQWYRRSSAAARDYVRRKREGERWVKTRSDRAWRRGYYRDDSVNWGRAALATVAGVVLVLAALVFVLPLL